MINALLSGSAYEMKIALKTGIVAALYLVFLSSAIVCLEIDPFETSESILFKDLFLGDNYDVNTRPVKNKSEPVQVSLDVALVQLVDLDDKDQSLKSNIWIRQRWVNELLTWDPKDYDGIDSLVVGKQFIWTPDIVLYNNAKNGKHMGSINQFLTRVEVTSNGLHKWYIPATLTSSCSIDVTYFPFDIQKCNLKFGSWTYLGHEINLTNFSDTVDLAAYLPSSSFFLREAKATRSSVFYSCCTDPYIDVTFELVLERQPGFYVYNVVVPSMVVTGFALLNFMLPDVTGSRMGLVFDCFLAITVTYMMVSDMMPVSSDSMPLISKFMIVCMSQMVLAVVTSAVSMRLRIDSPMPKMVRSIAIDWLAPMLGVTRGSCFSRMIAARKRKQKRDDDIDMIDSGRQGRSEYRSPYEDHESMEMLDISRESLSDSSGYPETSDSSCGGARRQKGALWDYFSSGFSSIDSARLPSRSDQKCLEDVETLVDEQNRLIEDDNTRDFWRCVSQIADRVFLLLFLISWIIMVSALFITAPVFHSTGA